jgi:hypothetical protein
LLLPLEMSHPGAQDKRFFTSLETNEREKIEGPRKRRKRAAGGWANTKAHKKTVGAHASYQRKEAKRAAPSPRPLRPCEIVAKAERAAEQAKQELSSVVYTQQQQLTRWDEAEAENRALQQEIVRLTYRLEEESRQRIMAEAEVARLAAEAGERDAGEGDELLLVPGKRGQHYGALSVEVHLLAACIVPVFL